MTGKGSSVSENKLCEGAVGDPGASVGGDDECWFVAVAYSGIEDDSLWLLAGVAGIFMDGGASVEGAKVEVTEDEDSQSGSW